MRQAVLLGALALAANVFGEQTSEPAPTDTGSDLLWKLRRVAFTFYMPPCIGKHLPQDG